MKKIFTTTALLLALLGGIMPMTSCESVTDDIEIPVPFDIPVTVSNQEIPFASFPTLDYVKYPEIKMDLDVNAKIKEKYPKLSIDNLKSAKLSKLEIKLNHSQLGTKLDLIKNARLYIKTPNLPEVLCATVTNNTNPDVITFTAVDAELIEYLRSNKNSLVLEIQAKSISLDKLNLDIYPSFNIKVGF